MTFWPLIYYNVRVYWKYCRLLVSIAFLFTLKASVWKSYFQLTSCNYMFTLCLRVWSMCWPSPNLLERLLICIVSRAVSVQVTPMGVSLWSHISHPSSNSSSVREKGFVIWLPASLCFLRSEAELWFIEKFPQAGSISRPTELLNGRSCSLGEWPFLERLLLRQVQGLIKVMSFFLLCHPLTDFSGYSEFSVVYQSMVRMWNDNMKQMTWKIYGWVTNKTWSLLL